MDMAGLAAEWNRLMAPRSGDIRADLVHEAAEFLGIPTAEAWDRLRGAGERFRAEWLATVGDPTDETLLANFYNRSDTELFELIEWHASDAIHYRTLILRDAMRLRPGRQYLDYGSGIGSDAVVFAEAGYGIGLADISDLLLGFAAFRCRQRGAAVHTIDLKSQQLPPDAYDVAVCFDVLEHIPAPVTVVRRIRKAMRRGGMVAIHAPFGHDPEHPMHVVHEDVVSPRMRAMGLLSVDVAFPPEVRAPLVYRAADVPVWERAGYYLYDVHLNTATFRPLAKAYKKVCALLRVDRRAWLAE